MRRWQLSAFALGTPAKRAKPLSAAVASAALPNIVLPKGDFRRSVCSRIHPPWTPPWCWLGLFASLQMKHCDRENVARHNKKGTRHCVANTTEEPGLKSIFPANAEAKCCGPPLRARPDRVEHYGTIIGGSLSRKGARKKARERKKRRSVCDTAPRVTFETVGVIGADVRDRIYRDRDHPSRARSANGDRLHPTSDGCGCSSPRGLRGVDGEPCRPDGCCDHGLQWLHEDDDRPGKCASGNYHR